MIVPMKKVSLVVLDSSRKQSLEELRKTGVLHLETGEGNSEELEGLHEKQARLDLARTALAVELYRVKEGRLPDHLTDLTGDYLETVPVDPFDDTPIKYRKLEKGYVIYSVGSDGKDDEGTKLDRVGIPLTDGTDIPFTVRR